MRIAERAVYAMSITPFDPEGGLDEALLRSHLRFLSAGGVGVFVCSQGSGEGDLLTSAEKLRIYEIAVEELHGVVPVCAAGIGLAGATAGIEALARGAVERGVDAVYVLPPRPSPHPPRPQEVERYYRRLIEAVDCPVILANNAFLAGYSLPLPTVATLVEAYPHLEAVLLVDANPSLLGQYVHAIGERRLVLTGVVSSILQAHAMGVDGVLCMEANVAPDLVPAIWSALEAGDLVAAERQYRRLLELSTAIARYGNPRSLKAALRAIGRDGGHLREPYLPLPQEELADLERSLHKAGLGPGPWEVPPAGRG
ncbi:MAG TPA: dihydrodipicolinate synthase family protein [Candidatus Dormibacteraeota bacterium]|nr:dihydrodipicolinate synthase family protein [Candidatus Dormibacteraeota bacterium]